MVADTPISRSQYPLRSPEDPKLPTLIEFKRLISMAQVRNTTDDQVSATLTNNKRGLGTGMEAYNSARKAQSIPSICYFAVVPSCETDRNRRFVIRFGDRRRCDGLGTGGTRPAALQPDTNADIAVAMSALVTRALSVRTRNKTKKHVRDRV
jgi:hypothetical protein